MLSAEHRTDIEWIHGVAESVPKPDASFDFAISEYGAAIWADPYVWIPEAHRLLRPGGELVFLGNSPLSQICRPSPTASPKSASTTPISAYIASIGPTSKTMAASIST
jgi:ubiquinone/menaquinone biosynthesis C-methylase UbiE